MRETVSSLKVYFICVAVLGLIGNVSVIATSQIKPISLIIDLIGLVLSAAYLYIGVSLRKLIKESPKLISNVILASMAYFVINFLIVLFSDFQVGLVVHLAMGLLVTWYLLNNVKRLSQGESAKTKVDKAA